MTTGNGHKRRELVQALMALPPISRMTRTQIDPGDVVVIEVTQKLSVEALQRATQLLQRAFPHNRVLILDDGAKLKIGQTVP